MPISSLQFVLWEANALSFFSESPSVFAFKDTVPKFPASSQDDEALE